MNIYWAEQMRIAMQCSQAAHSQCQMMMFLPWTYWLPKPRKPTDE